MTAHRTNLADPIYHDDHDARAHLEALLWPQCAVCPRCGIMGDWITKLHRALAPASAQVGPCGSIYVGEQEGMSALQLQRMLGTNYETAWFLFHRLRECRKRHVLVDTLGLLLNVDVHATSVQDRDGAVTLLRDARKRFPFIKRIIGEGGYQGPKMAAVVNETGA